MHDKGASENGGIGWWTAALTCTPSAMPQIWPCGKQLGSTEPALLPSKVGGPDAPDEVRRMLPPVDGELHLVSKQIRLEDMSAVVVSAASRCLEQLVAVLCADNPSAKLSPRARSAFSADSRKKKQVAVPAARSGSASLIKMSEKGDALLMPDVGIDEYL